MSQGTDATHVESLISGLSAAGTVDSVGGFTLDRDKARDKMRQFQLAEPHRYVLELVQAAVLKGATRIDFHIDADDMRMTFDGRPFTTDDFDALYSSLFARMSSPQNDARQHLAVGLNAAMALNPRYVRVDSGTGKARVRLELRPQQEDRFETREADAGAPTVIHVKARLGPGLVVAFYHDKRGTIPEEKLLRTHCARARTKIYLDDVSINRGYDLPGAVAVQPIVGEGVSGLVGFDPSHTAGASIEWIKQGVWITTHDFHPDRDRAWVEALGLDTYHGFVAVVEADALRMDFSRQDVVWDDAYRDVLAVLRKARDEAVKEICGWRRFGIPGGWATALLKRVTARLTLEALCSDEDDSLGATVARADLWTTITGKPVSFVELWQEVQQRGSLGFSFVGWTEPEEDPELGPEAPGGGRLVLRLVNAAEEGLLRRYFGDSLRNVTARLQTRLETAQNYRQFRKRQMQVRLPAEHRYLATVELNGPGLTGVLGLRHDQGTSGLALVCQGCLLRRIENPHSVPGLEAVVEGAFTPDPTFTDAQRDEAYGAAVHLVLGSLKSLFTHAVDGISVMSRQWRAAFITHLDNMLTPDFAGSFLRSWGAQGLAQIPDLDLRLGVGILPPPQGSDLPHPMCYLPLIEDVNGRGWSLVELAKELDRSDALPWIPSSLPALPNHPTLLLRLDAPALRVLEQTFGARLRNDSAAYRQRLRRAAHLQKPRQSLELRDQDPALINVGFECGSLRGLLQFRPVGESLSVSSSLVTLLIEQRALQSYNVELGVPDLAAALNDDTLVPNDEWSDLRDPVARGRCQRILHAAALEVLCSLASGLHRGYLRHQAPVRWLLRKALSTLCPWAPFGEALRWLLAHDEDPWERFMALTSLQSHVELDKLVTGLHALMAAGRPPSAEALWAQLYPGAAMPEPVPGLQVDLSPCWKIGGGAPPPGEPNLPLIQLLDGLPLFRTSTGAWIDLATLRQRAAEAPLPYLTTEPDAALVKDRLVLLAPGRDRDDLIRLLGAESLTDGRPLLEARRKVAEFESRGASSLRLLPGTTLVQRSLNTAGITGEVGLAAELAEGSWVLLHKDRRYVCRQEGIFSQGLVAVLNANDLGLTEDFRNVLADAARARALAACEDSLPTLLTMLLHGWPNMPDERRDVAYDHLLTFAVSASGPQRRTEQPLSDLVGVLSRLRWLPGVAGQRYSLEDMRAEVVDHGELVYLPAPLPGGSNRRVLILAGRRLGLIRQLFDRVRDDSDAWEEAHLREVLGLSDAPALPPHHPDDELVGAPCRGAGFEGRLYLPRAADEPLVLRFGLRSVELHQETLSDFAPCAGRLETTRTTLRQSGGQIHLGPHDRYNLQTICFQLYRSLIDLTTQLDDPAQKQWVRALLRNLTLGLHARLADQLAVLEARWIRLYGTLAELPLFDLPGGGLMSLTAARARRPPELAALGLWPEQPLAEPPAPAQPPNTEAPQTPEDNSLDQAFAVANLPIPREELQPRKPQPPKPQPKEAGAPAEPAPQRSAMPPLDSPTARLARGLRRAFERLGQGVTLSPLVAAGHLEVSRHLQRNLWLTAGQGGGAVRCDEGGLMLYRDHPLVSAALARAEADPLLLSLLLSAVYTAVNLHLEQVTDDHENAFLDALAEGVLADLGQPGSAQDLRIPLGEVT